MAIRIAPAPVAAVSRGSAPDQAPGLYVVKRGDTLSAIARQVLGDARRWPELAALNADRLPSPDHLRVGLVLKVTAVAPTGKSHRASVSPDRLQLSSAARRPAPALPQVAVQVEVPALPPARNARPAAAATTASAAPTVAPPAPTEARMRSLTRSLLAPMADRLVAAVQADPAIAAGLQNPAMSRGEKLAFLKQLSGVVARAYEMPPVTVAAIDRPWLGGEFEFGGDRRFEVTNALLDQATPGTLLYLSAHELLHAYQETVLESPHQPTGALAELAAAWRANRDAYVTYDPKKNNQVAYAEQPLEYGAYLVGNSVEKQVTGHNALNWGQPDEAAQHLKDAP